MPTITIINIIMFRYDCKLKLKLKLTIGISEYTGSLGLVEFIVHNNSKLLISFTYTTSTI
jgi:hypothetical protein